MTMLNYAAEVRENVGYLSPLLDQPGERLNFIENDNEGAIIGRQYPLDDIRKSSSDSGWGR